MPLYPLIGPPTVSSIQWMRPTTRKFHFLKAVTIVVDQTVLHKAYLLGNYPQ